MYDRKGTRRATTKNNNDDKQLEKGKKEAHMNLEKQKNIETNALLCNNSPLSHPLILSHYQSPSLLLSISIICAFVLFITFLGGALSHQDWCVCALSLSLSSSDFLTTSLFLSISIIVFPPSEIAHSLSPSHSLTIIPSFSLPINL